VTAYLTRMPAGIPGEVSRGQSAIIEPAALTPFGTTGRPLSYGVPVVVDTAGGNAGRMRIAASGDAAGSIYGILVRPFPTGASQDALGVQTLPEQAESCDVLRFGYMTVLLSGSTDAVKGAPVYIWKSAAASTHITGGFESTDPTTDGFAIPATFMGPKDANNIVEIFVDFGP
jgi:hypothetical protein